MLSGIGRQFSPSASPGSTGGDPSNSNLCITTRGTTSTLGKGTELLTECLNWVEVQMALPENEQTPRQVEGKEVEAASMTTICK